MILDAAGTPVVTSNAKGLGEESGSSNVGSPSSKEGIDHFVTTLRQTAPGRSGGSLAALRRGLETKP